MNNKGLSIVEVLTSLAVISLIILSVSSALLTSSKQTAKSQQTIENLTEDNYLRNYLSNPEFVGQLASYPENKALLKCIANDGEFCDSTKSYPFTVYDLYTKKPLNTSDQKDSNKKLSFEFTGVCPKLATVCDSVSYINIKIIGTERTMASINEEQRTNIVSVKPINNNVIVMYPESSLKKGGPVNLMLLVDTTNSMAYTQNIVKEGLRQVLDKLTDNQVNIIVSTIDSANTYFWTDYYFYVKDGVEVPVTTESPKEELTNNALFMKSSLNFNNKSTSFKLDPKSTAVQKNTVLNKIGKFMDAALMDNISGISASKDYGLCTLSYFLQEYRKNKLALNQDPQATTLIYVISNEEDESLLVPIGEEKYLNPSYDGDCAYSSVAPVKYEESAKMKELSREYYMTEVEYEVNLEISYLNDGVPATTTATFFLPGVIGENKTETACEADFGTTTESRNLIMQPVREYFGSNPTYKIKKCHKLYSKNLVTWQVSQTQIKMEDLCKTKFAPTPANQKKYKSYDLATCEYDEYIHDFPPFSYFLPLSAEKVSESYPGADMVAASINSLKATFPKGNYHINFSIIPTNGSCPKEVYNEFGVRYENVAKGVSKNSSITPVCEGKFSTDAIYDGLEKVESVISNSIELSEVVAAKVTGITLVKDGVSTVLNKIQDYTIEKNQILLKNELIDSKTQILIYYAF